VHDSPNSAGIVIDAVRCCKLALDRGIGGALEARAVLHEVTPVQYSDAEARGLVEESSMGGKAPRRPCPPPRKSKPAAAAARR